MGLHVRPRIKTCHMLMPNFGNSFGLSITAQPQNIVNTFLWSLIFYITIILLFCYHMKYTYSKTLNPNAHAANLDSYSEKELKDKFSSDIQNIRSFVKQIEGKMTGEKRAMPITADRENKSKRSTTMKLDSRESVESRKVEAPMMKKCGVILHKLMKHKHGWVFNNPVDVVALRIPDYNEVVGTIKANLDKRIYGTPLDFAKDVRLTFENALLYNRKGEEVYNMAAVLLDMFDKLFEPAYEKFAVEYEKFDKEDAENSGSKKRGTVPEGEENSLKRREMSELEREQVGDAIEELSEKYLTEILQIIGKRNFKMTIGDANGDAELDPQAVDNETMWDLEEFVRLKGRKNKKANSSTHDNSH